MTGHPPESPEGLVAEIEAALIATSNPERARNEKRYLKSDLRFIGVAKPLIRRAVRPALRSGAISDRDSLLDFAEAMLGDRGPRTESYRYSRLAGKIHPP